MQPLKHPLSRTNALFLAAAALAFGLGPLGSTLLQQAPAALGFVEAHALTLVFSAWLWRARLDCRWHLGAAAGHLLLLSANLALWPQVADANPLAATVATSAHAVFPSLHLYALYETLYPREASQPVDAPAS